MLKKNWFTAEYLKTSQVPSFMVRQMSTSYCKNKSPKHALISLFIEHSHFFYRVHPFTTQCIGRPRMGSYKSPSPKD